MTTNIERDVLALVETYLPPLLPADMSYSPEASKVLRRALVRDYVEDDFSMEKHIDSPFTEAKGFQLFASYNRRDFRVPEFDMRYHLETFGDGALPRKPFKFWAAACVYPLPPKIMPIWRPSGDGTFHKDGEHDGNKGNYTFAILYFNELPVMDWTPPAFEDNDLPPGSHYAREALWHEQERTGLKPIDDYWRHTQLPHDARVYAQRRRRGIPLTPYQERVMEAGGWPYPDVVAPEPEEPEHAQEDRMVSDVSGASGAGDGDGDGSGGQRDSAGTVGGASGAGPGVSGAVDVEEVTPEPTDLPEYTDLILLIESYCAEQDPGSAHVIRWRRAQAGLGRDTGYDAMTAAEARSYADKGWTRWVPVAKALRKIEKERG